MALSKPRRHGEWDELNMSTAVGQVLEGESQKSAARHSGVPRQTLRRHLAIVRGGGTVSKCLGRKPVLNREQEKELVEVLMTMEKRLFGVSIANLRKYVFQYCEANDVAHPFNKDKMTAGRDWVAAFLKRNPELSIRKPEATSIHRALGFNEGKVKIFFDTLKSVLFCDNGTRQIPPDHIFNADESGFTTVHKPGKILAQKGKRAVGAITSGERGKTVTVLCCVSASGQYIPPLFIFPRVRMRDDFMDRAPASSIGTATPTGWISEEAFGLWFSHFLEKVGPKHRASPTLLILDGHSSHTRNLPVIMKARENNVILLSLPSHCTHKLQPLDVGVFKSINTFYDQAVSTWLTNHPGRVVTEREIPELFGIAYAKGATIHNAQSGFRRTGIHPFNPHIFSEEDFIPAELTAQPEPSTSELPAQESQLSLPSPFVANVNSLPSCSGSCRATNVSSPSPQRNDDSNPSSSTINTDPSSPSCSKDNVDSFPSCSASNTPKTKSAPNENHSPFFRDLIKVPAKIPRKPSNRKVAHSVVLTGSPHKRKVEDSKASVGNSKRSQKQPTLANKKKRNLSRKMQNAYSSTNFSVSGGEWIQCQTCNKWCHVECSGVDKKDISYVCDL